MKAFVDDIGPGPLASMFGGRSKSPEVPIEDLVEASLVASEEGAAAGAGSAAAEIVVDGVVTSDGDEPSAGSGD